MAAAGRRRLGCRAATTRRVSRRIFARLPPAGQPATRFLAAAARAETAAKIGAEFSGGKMDSSARAIAEEIFRMMLHDAEMRVRKELSESLKHSPLVPHDVALSLAKDVIDVAEPMLMHSQVLTDEDLIEIVRTEPSSSRVTVARRQTVSSAVSDALVESQDEDAVVTLAGTTATVRFPAERIVARTASAA